MERRRLTLLGGNAATTTGLGTPLTLHVTSVISLASGFFGTHKVHLAPRRGCHAHCGLAPRLWTVRRSTKIILLVVGAVWLAAAVAAWILLYLSR